ncbi:MAG: DUF2460 domain-containing protein [Phycisphaeraceae bacterium]|nr:DUF2460 domain-containing protein [Phycisphaeraceae bacterium]
MAFHDVPIAIVTDEGSAGGPEVNVAILETDSGAEQRVARWSEGRHSFDAGYSVRTRDEMYALTSHFRARGGPLHSFPVKDLNDYTTATNGRGASTFTDQVIGTGDGTKTQFQLVKRYTSGPTTVVRNLSKPVTSTVRVAINGTEQLSGWSVDRATGIVTFTVAPTAGANVTAGCEFDVEVRYDIQSMKAAIVAFDSGSVPNVPLIEVRDDKPVSHEWDAGGCQALSISADYQLAAGAAMVYLVTATAGSLTVRLPNPASMTPGLHGSILNVGATNAFAIKKHDGTDLSPSVSLATGTGVRLFLTLDSIGGKVWYVG